MKKQLVLNEKFKQHMEAHNKEFNKNFKEYLTEDVVNKILNECKTDFNIVNVIFKETVGLLNIVEVKENDEIFWAKRKGRNIYSRFVKNREPEKTNIITFILKEQHYNKGNFNLISMYPSVGVSAKEVFDSNINSVEDLEKSIDFWTRYAFTGEYQAGTDKDIIEVNRCLYNKDYQNIHEEIIPRTMHRLYLKNLYFGSKTIKWYDEFGDFTETQCRYTGLKFNYMNNGYEFKIGYAGNEKNDFEEEMILVG